MKPEGKSILDIGGGIGIIQIKLLKFGAAKAVSVDAAHACISVARKLAQEQGVDHRITYQLGDFVEVADAIQAADIVTLDKVICCYADMTSLVSLSSKRARNIIAAVYPRDNLWLTAILRLRNLVMKQFVRVPFLLSCH